IASTIAAPIYGRLGDSFGRRRLMFLALAVFIVASALCAASTSILLLTLARLVQGLGGGGLMTLSQALVGEAFPPRERARYQGYLAAVAVCANTFGPVAGGYLTQHFGWQSVFLINVPVGLLAVWLTRNLESRIPDKSSWRPDPAGLLLFTLFVTTTLLSLEQARHMELAALPVAGGLLAIGIIAAALLIRQRSPACAPLLPPAARRPRPRWRRRAATARRWCRSSPSFRSICKWWAATPRGRRGCCWCRSRSASSPARWSPGGSSARPAAPLFSPLSGSSSSPPIWWCWPCGWT